MGTGFTRDLNHIQSTAGSKTPRSLYAGLQPDGYIKIGMSRTPKIRVQSLGLRLIHYTAPCLWPHVAERIAHGVLKRYGRHISGETFRVTPMQAATIIDGAVESVATARSAASWWNIGVDLEISHLPRLIPHGDEDVAPVMPKARHAEPSNTIAYLAAGFFPYPIPGTALGAFGSKKARVNAHNLPGVGLKE